MRIMYPEIGSYGVSPATRISTYEDECVGSGPLDVEGIIVTRVDGEKVFVRDWHINSYFEGDKSLKQFEETKHSQSFDFSFSNERELKEEEQLNGADSILRGQLCKKLEAEQQDENVTNKMTDKLRKMIQRKH